MDSFRHANVADAIEQDLDTVLQHARAVADKEVADAANRLIGLREQGLLQIVGPAAQAFLDSNSW